MHWSTSAFALFALGAALPRPQTIEHSGGHVFLKSVTVDPEAGPVDPENVNVHVEGIDPKDVNVHVEAVDPKDAAADPKATNVVVKTDAAPAAAPVGEQTGPVQQSAPVVDVVTSSVQEYAPAVPDATPVAPKPAPVDSSPSPVQNAAPVDPSPSPVQNAAPDAPSTSPVVQEGGAIPVLKEGDAPVILEGAPSIPKDVNAAILHNQDTLNRIVRCQASPGSQPIQEGVILKGRRKDEQTPSKTTILFPPKWQGMFYTNVINDTDTGLARRSEAKTTVLAEFKFDGGDKHDTTFYDVSRIDNLDDSSNVKMMMPAEQKQPISGCQVMTNCTEAYIQPNDVQTKATPEKHILVLIGEQAAPAA